MRTQRLIWAVAIAIGQFAAAPPAHAQARRAVLIGINTYLAPENASSPGKPPRAGGRPREAFGNLHGAVNDVEALRAVLVARFGFKPEDVHVLLNRDATRARILGSIRTWLITGAAPGDVSFFYYAGHGSQVRNSRSSEPDKLDESIVPADSNAGSLDIRDKEIATIFGEALDKHVLLTVGFDSCHSGSISRGQFRPVLVRGIAPDLRDAADPANPPSIESRGGVVLSAAQSHQLAGETIDQDGSDHGVFTSAVIRTLRSMPINESVDRIFLSVRALMHVIDPTQDPDLSASPLRRQAPLFGGMTDARGALRVAVRSVNPDGTFTLEGGLATGIRPDCELRTVGGGATDAAVLRVSQTEGLDLSRALIIQGDPVRVTPGSLLEITRWTSPGGAALRVWLGTAVSNPQGLADQTIATLSTDPSLQWIDDPSDDAAVDVPTAVVEWNGPAWELLIDGKMIAMPQAQAGRIVATNVAADRAGKRRVFLDLPIADEIRSRLGLGTGTANDAIETLSSAAGADYALAGRRTLRGVEYAWIRPLVGRNAGRSPLPTRTDWVAFDPQHAEDAAAALQRQIIRLRVIKGWLDLESPPGAARIPYHLALKSAKTGELQTSGDIRAGDLYGLVLTFDDALGSHVSPQHAYVFIIDSAGKGQLLYPSTAAGGGENFLPLRDETGRYPREIALGPPDLLEVKAPLGIDTYVMLLTTTPLADPDVLTGDAVRRVDESRGATDALTRLLLTSTAGVRGAPSSTPLDWAIERMSIGSVPSSGKRTYTRQR